METKLKKYFPMIQTKGEVMGKIRESVKMTEMFYSWKNDQEKTTFPGCSITLQNFTATGFSATIRHL